MQRGLASSQAFVTGLTELLALLRYGSKYIPQTRQVEDPSHVWDRDACTLMKTARGGKGKQPQLCPKQPLEKGNLSLPIA